MKHSAMTAAGARWFTRLPALAFALVFPVGAHAANAENGLALAEMWCNSCQAIGTEEPRQETRDRSSPTLPSRTTPICRKRSTGRTISCRRFVLALPDDERLSRASVNFDAFMRFPSSPSQGFDAESSNQDRGRFRGSHQGLEIDLDHAVRISCSRLA